jgi:hypothetical protein
MLSTSSLGSVATDSQQRITQIAEYLSKMAFLTTFKIKLLRDSFEFPSRNLRYSRRCEKHR